MFEDDDSDPPSLPYVRGSETSKAAAKLASSNAKNLARQIFDLIIEAGDYGMTTDQLNVIFEPRGHRNQAVSARVKDLSDKGMITRGPDTRVTRSNAAAEVSRAIPGAAADFDLYWHRRVAKSPKQRALERAVHDLKQLIKQISTQALTHSSDLPTFAQAQKLITDSLLSLYVNLSGSDR